MAQPLMPYLTEKACALVGRIDQKLASLGLGFASERI